MKRILYILSFLLILSSNGLALNWSDVDQIVLKYPRNIKDPELIANRIQKDFSNESDQLRALYCWLANTVEYDVNRSRKTIVYSYTYVTEEEKKQKEQEILYKSVKRTLSRKRAVCHGYSHTFFYIAKLLGIECRVVVGWSKTRLNDIVKIDKEPNHAWNIVKIDGEWKNIDVTWGAGYLDEKSNKFVKHYSDIYFLMPEKDFYLQHLPKDDIFQISRKDKQRFQKLPLFYPLYFKSNTQLIYPLNGKIILKRGQTIKLVFKGEPKGILSAGFSTERYTKRIEGKRQGNNYVYEIHCNGRNYNELTIFLNSESILAFIVRKR